jgi:PhoPQ-activated pathogenicity-related protein
MLNPNKKGEIMKKKKQLIFISLILLLLISIITNVFLYNANTKYEKYLSTQIANHVVQISQSALYNLGIIQDVLASNKLTEADAEELEMSFKDLVTGVQSISDLVIEIGR